MKLQKLEDRYYRLLNAELLNSNDIDNDVQHECYSFHPDTVVHSAPLLNTANLMKKVLALQKLQQLLDETVENRVDTKPATAFKTSTPGRTEAKAERPKKQKLRITLNPAIPKSKEPETPEEH